MKKTAVNWIAYKVEYDSPCMGREVVGYFQCKGDAEIAMLNFADKNKISEKGICCGNIKHLTLEEIIIQS
jgi:hypothetical protein